MLCDMRGQLDVSLLVSARRGRCSNGRSRILRNWMLRVRLLWPVRWKVENEKHRERCGRSDQPLRLLLQLLLPGTRNDVR